MEGGRGGRDEMECGGRQETGDLLQLSIIEKKNIIGTLERERL